ncbi:Crp/Fnr family transcriptional regulator [Pedobacter ginsengisoli]|uniref:Crp/Fnr family transcriptional regulator n=1 Tax=Pedobacter ginsengisoli TaxID=363852 RepID=UPI00254DA5A0|nr:Crp/Fnr family transcriptional regulator [Pedobacter ginsengisoli]
MYREILDHIRKYVVLTPEEEELLCQNLEYKKYHKKDFLLEAGKTCKGNYFIIRGCVRQYFINKKLNEQIINFSIENWWIADQDSLMTGRPSACTIQAIEETEVFLLPEKNKAALFRQVPSLETYFALIMQKAFVAAQRRLGYIFNMTDEERFRHFSSLFPEFIQRVPQYMLASYLGFTPQFLSRLRAKKH